jgi:ABC-type nitrate/sulfonate/bicarbonate transport system permease component
MTAAVDPWVASGPTEEAGGNRERRTAALLRVTSIALFFAVWYAAALLNTHVFKVFNPLLLPAPHTVLFAGVDMVRSGELQRDILASMSRVVQGFALAAIVAVAVGTAVGR